MIIKGGIGGNTIAGTSSADTIYGGDASDPAATNGNIDVTLIENGLGAPLFVTYAPGDANGLYIVQKGGEILRYDLNAGTTTSFLDISGADFNQSGERGLLGLAFDPDYATNDKFYVTVTRADGDVQVREYTHAGAATAATDINTRANVITIEHTAEDNHNGGWIGFHPTNGLLYIAVGDGGGGGDPENDAQNVNSLLGKMLRIDVGADQFPADANRNYAIPGSNPYAGATAGADEIFATGLRNPWRNSFDAAGNLWIADVGQSQREEVNFVAASSNGGQNFGWHIREGTLTHTSGAFGPGAVTNPIHQYSHAIGNSITGGYAYGGPGAGLKGNYIFGDFGSGRVFALERDGAVSAVEITAALSQSVGSIASFGQDASGNLYAVDYAGSVFRLTPSAGAGDGNDVINAGAGNDVVYGGAGHDRIFAGDGNDNLSGGGGNDLLDGGAGADLAAYNFATSAVSVNLALTGAQSIGGSQGADTLKSIEKILGSSFNDTLTGNSAANVFDGRGGNDAINGGAGIDSASDSAATCGVTVSLALSGAQAVGGGQGSDTLISIETLSGSAYDDTLSGNTSPNTLFGGAGNDTLVGGWGHDALSGGAGFDAFVFNTTPGAQNVDRISDFNPAFDTIHLTGSVYAALGGAGVLAAGQFRIGAGAADADDHIIYNSSSGALTYDSNGNASGGAVQFASLAAGLALTNQDFLII